MTVRRRMNRDVVIVPSSSNGARFGERLAVEHDMNDAINARLDWLSQHQSEIKKREEDAAKGAVHKLMEASQQSTKKLLFWVLAFLCAAPIITYIEYLIYLKITRG